MTASDLISSNLFAAMRSVSSVPKNKNSRVSLTLVSVAGADGAGLAVRAQPAVLARVRVAVVAALAPLPLQLPRAQTAEVVRQVLTDTCKQFQNHSTNAIEASSR